MDEPRESQAVTQVGMVRASVRHGSGTIIVKLVRIAQEMLVAAVLAVTPRLDGWLAAYALASLPVNLLLHAYQPPFVARLASAPSPGPLRAGLIHAFGAGLCGAVLVLVAGPAWFERALAVDASRIAAIEVLPVLMLFTITGALNIVLNGALQARGCFFAAGVIPVFVPAAVAGAILLAPGGDVSSMAVGLAVGSGLEVLASILVLAARLDQRIDDSRREMEPGTSVARASVVLLPGVACIALVPLVEQYFASRAGGAGGVAVLGYAQRLPYFLAGTLSLTLSAVATTVLARHGDATAGGRALLVRTGAWILAGTSGLVLPLAYVSTPLTATIFERGEFSAAATELVAPALAVLLLGLPFTLLRLLAVRALTVAGRNGAAAGVLALALVLAGAFNLAVLPAGQGVTGVAAASSLATAFSAVIAWLLALSPGGSPAPAGGGR